MPSSLYPILLCLLAASMTTSVFAANLIWTLLAVNWLAEWNWKEKFAGFRSNRMLHAFLVLIAVYVVGMLWTSNLEAGLRVLRENLPMLLIPLVILTSRPLTRKELCNIGIAHIGTVLVVTIIGLVRYLTQPQLPYRQIVPYISHIRFGLNICFDLVLLAYAAVRYRKGWLWAVNGALALWLLCFLLLIRAYTAFAVIAVLSVVLLACYGGRLSRKVRRGAWGGVLALALAVAGISTYYARQYYTLQPLSTEPLRSCTVNGAPYDIKTGFGGAIDDGFIENGNYLFRYVCEEEMERQWNRISDHPYNLPNADGYSIYSSLVRYLNGMGVTKDSLGMTHLTAADVAAIEQGVANPVYLQPGLRKMFYVLFYERENYRCYHNVSHFTMLQRFELWGNAWQVFCAHPFFGVGTGDILDQCHDRLYEIDSPLTETALDTHCQYLHLLVGYGLVGFLLIVFFFIRAIVGQRCGRSVLFGAFLCIALVSFLTEDTLITLAGMLFFVLGCCLTPQAALPEPDSQDR